MKKMIPIAFVLMLVAVVFAVADRAIAEDFMPRKLVIDGGFVPGFQFGIGKSEFHVTVSGSDAIVYLAIFDCYAWRDVDNVTSNHLPWHTVNKIDTCVYVSPPYYLTEGEHDIEWDGRTSNGDMLRQGYYTYYLWGIDAEGSKQLVARDIAIPPGGGVIQIHDYNDNPLDQPVFYPSTDVYATGTDSVKVTRSRWPIGADPLDAGAIEQTWYHGAPNWAERGPLAFSPYALDDFFATGYDLQEGRGSMRRFHWVTGGEAVWDTDWGEDDGEVRFQSGYSSMLLHDPGAVRIEDVGMLLSAAYTGDDDLFRSMLTFIDAQDGYNMVTIDYQPWWQPSQGERDSAFLLESIQCQTATPFIIVGNHLDCLYHMLSPYEFEDSWLRYCIELPVPPEQTAQGIPALDKEGFALLPGMVNGGRVGLLAPDGTWMGLLPLVDDGSSYSSMIPIDYGSAFDGIYFSALAGDSAESGLWYRGCDTFSYSINMRGNYYPTRIIRPNGGEILTAGSIYTVHLENTIYGGSELKYSIDNGATWTMIDSVSAGRSISYDWTVPNVSSDECLIRVEWLSNEILLIKPSAFLKYDQSDAPFTITGGVHTGESHPLAFTVFPASPNPFNPSTAIEFILPEKLPVTVTVYTALGQRVARLQDGILDAGRHRVMWNAADAGPGLYFYRVETNAGTKTGKMMLVK